MVPPIASGSPHLNLISYKLLLDFTLWYFIKNLFLVLFIIAHFWHWVSASEIFIISKKELVCFQVPARFGASLEQGWAGPVHVLSAACLLWLWMLWKHSQASCWNVDASWFSHAVAQLSSSSRNMWSRKGKDLFFGTLQREAGWHCSGAPDLSNMVHSEQYLKLN